MRVFGTPRGRCLIATRPSWRGTGDGSRRSICVILWALGHRPSPRFCARSKTMAETSIPALGGPNRFRFRPLPKRIRFERGV